MLYHSPLKHFVKGLLGRKNDAWYFDRMVKAYDTRQQQLTQQLLAQAEAWAHMADEEIIMPAAAVPHPLYARAMELRHQLLHSVQQVQLLKGKTVVFQMPPAAFSPGWASWFGSLADGMRWMGATVHEVWEVWPPEWLQTADYFFSQANPVFTQQWPAELASWRKTGAVFACYCSFEQLNADAAVALYRRLAAAGINCLLNAADHDFIANNPHTTWAAAAELPIISLPFAANPLRHYPTPWWLPQADYVFLGSANYDKARRYHDFFYPVIRRYKGVLAGQGWPWITDYIMNAQRDRWMYAQAVVAINLHLDFQVNGKNEMNERLYAAFACGAHQLVDNPALLFGHYPMYSLSAETPLKYHTSFERMRKERGEYAEVMNTCMEHTFSSHTIFQRVQDLLIKYSSFL